MAFIQRNRMQKLARTVDGFADRDAERMQREAEIHQLRVEAATTLHGVCMNFAAELNPLLQKVRVEVSPDQFQPDQYQADRPTIFQINASGRLVQFTFQATETWTANHDFRLPYTLEGSVQSFSQEEIDHSNIHEYRLFCCLEGKGSEWYWLDIVKRESGKVDIDYIATMLEHLS
jgi:hypothetical protein